MAPSPNPDPDPDRVVDIRLDSAAVRVLAHPLRSQLLSALRQGGPSTATDLAHQLETNTGVTSYHLRQLAEVGLVEDTGGGHGRRREWRATSRSHSWQMSDFADDEDAQASMGWLTRDYVHRSAVRMQHWLDVESTWPMAWRDVLSISDHPVTVTTEQARAMYDEILAVVDRYRSAGVDDPSAIRVELGISMHPVDLEAPPTR